MSQQRTSKEQRDHIVKRLSDTVCCNDDLGGNEEAYHVANLGLDLAKDLDAADARIAQLEATIQRNQERILEFISVLGRIYHAEAFDEAKALAWREFGRLAQEVRPT